MQLPTLTSFAPPGRNAAQGVQMCVCVWLPNGKDNGSYQAFLPACGLHTGGQWGRVAVVIFFAVSTSTFFRGGGGRVVGWGEEGVVVVGGVPSTTCWHNSLTTYHNNLPFGHKRNPILWLDNYRLCRRCVSPSRPWDDAERCHVKHLDVVYLFVPSQAPRREPRRARCVALPFLLFLRRYAPSVHPFSLFILLSSVFPQWSDGGYETAGDRENTWLSRHRQKRLDGCHDTRPALHKHSSLY